MWYPQNKVPYWWKRQSIDIIDIIWYGIFNNTHIAYMARRIQYCLQLSSKRILLKWAKPFVRNLCSLFRGLGPQRNNQICRIVRLPPHCGSGEIGGISLDVVDQFLVIVVAKQVILWSAEMITFFKWTMIKTWDEWAMFIRFANVGFGYVYQKPEMLGHFGRKNGQMP